MTDRTFNLLAIAVLPERQSHGAGKLLIRALEQQLSERDGRVLLVETSGLDEYKATRGFYDRQGFTREARIRDFYSEGNDKIVFWKRL